MWSTLRFNTSADISKSLRTSLETFVRLYGQRKDDLQQASEHFMHAAALVDKKHEDDKMAQALLGVFGGAIGIVFGGVTGGVWAALGAVSAATYAKFCGNVSAASATVGFLGGVFGGVVGGAFSGFIGGSVGVAALAAGIEAHGIVSDSLWFTVGFATGGATGSTFGGSIGAAGGAVGGGFGALHATKAAVYLVRKAIDFPSKTKVRKGNGKLTKEVVTMQKTGADFIKSIEPLVDELKTVQEICDQMASCDAVKGVANQTAKTLAAVNAMEKTMNHSQMEADESEFLRCVKEASSQCKIIPVELQMMREEVEKLLVSL